MQIVHLGQDKVNRETQAQLYPDQEASFNKSREVTDKDDIGKNLTPIQTLKRKYEDLERYIVGLGHRVDQWEKKRRLQI